MTQGKVEMKRIQKEVTGIRKSKEKRWGDTKKKWF